MTSKLLACTVGWQMAPFTDIGNLEGEKGTWVGGMFEHVEFEDLWNI